MLAVRETSIFQHNGDPIKGPLKPPPQYDSAAIYIYCSIYIYIFFLIYMHVFSLYKVEKCTTPETKKVFNHCIYMCIYIYIICINIYIIYVYASFSCQSFHSCVKKKFLIPTAVNKKKLLYEK